MTKEPLFNISERAPVWLAGFLICIYALSVFLPNSISNPVLNASVLIPLGVFDRSVEVQAWSLVAHGFFHGSWSHVLMNSAMIIAFGVVTIRGAKLLAASKGRPAKGESKFLLIFFAGVIGGGLAQWGYWALVGGPSAALGASGGASALFAAGAWAMGGKNKLLSFGVGWMFINLILVIAEPVFGVAIAWAAHLGGYLAGALFAPLCVRANCTGFSVTR